VLKRVAVSEGIDIGDGTLALIARHATGSFRDALGTLEQLVTYAAGETISASDVLAVLGVADSDQLFEAVDAVIARDPAAALRAANRLAESGRDPGQVLRDLEVHARELLTVQILDEVPAELRVTPERDQRVSEQARALTGSDAVRMLDLVSQALDATTNGAQARIQLELVLIKGASPELEPSIAALLARIERLERGLGGAPQPAAASAPQPAAASAPPPATVAQVEVATTPAEPPPLDGGIPLDIAVSSWPAVIEQVRGANAMLAALLADARPVAVREREVTIAFPSGAAFLKRKAEQDDHRRAAIEAFRTITGQALILRYELREDDDEPAQAGEQVLSGEELVRRFLEEFDAEELGPAEDDPDERKAN
jgi:DNA polymerase-3 subunit gamma/tau